MAASCSSSTTAFGLHRRSVAGALGEAVLHAALFGNALTGARTWQRLQAPALGAGPAAGGRVDARRGGSSLYSGVVFAVRWLLR